MENPRRLFVLRKESLKTNSGLIGFRTRDRAITNNRGLAGFAVFFNFSR